MEEICQLLSHQIPICNILLSWHCHKLEWMFVISTFSFFAVSHSLCLSLRISIQFIEINFSIFDGSDDRSRKFKKKTNKISRKFWLSGVGARCCFISQIKCLFFHISLFIIFTLFAYIIKIHLVFIQLEDKLSLHEVNCSN